MTLLHGDVISTLKTLDADSIDAIVTDPPYNLSFMSKEWDSISDFQQWCTAWGEEALRVLKPGGHILAFGGTRTYHRLTCALEDAGFEIRDTVMWLYGSGFPKSLDVSKAIDRAAGAERAVVGYDAERARPNRKYEGGAIGNIGGTGTPSDRTDNGATITAPATPDAEKWQGWGTALKPAFEPIVLARKPLIGTVAKNVLTHGAGALNIDGCRVGTEERLNPSAGNKAGGASLNMSAVGMPDDVPGRVSQGRWPANVILDEEAGELLDEQSGTRKSGTRKSGTHTVLGSAGIYGDAAEGEMPEVVGSTGGASRFFYCAKTPKKERNAGLSDGEKNGHPTVKPVALMTYLVRLITPPGGTVLDPFVGSGSTGIAAAREGFDFIGIDNNPEYLEIAAKRIEAA